MKTKVSLMEIVWLVVAGLSLGFFIDAMVRTGWHKASMFLVFAGISILMYLWRRSLRRSEQDGEDE